MKRIRRERCTSFVSASYTLLWASPLLHELREEPEPPRAALLARLHPMDLVLAEGWKTGEPHDSTIITVASEPGLDPSAYGRPGLPAFPLADLERIAGLVAEFAR